jgi:chromosome partitioning protein
MRRGVAASRAVAALGVGPSAPTNRLQPVVGDDRPHDQGSARVVAIAAHKGGVGKTTTAIVLAAGLARDLGHRVLLVDLDPQGCATRGLIAADVTYHELGTADLFTDSPRSVGAVARDTQVPGLVMVPSSLRLERHAQWLASATDRGYYLQHALAPELACFDWIVLDCQPSLGPLVENACRAATDIIVPVRMEARSPESIVDLEGSLRQWRRDFDAWWLLRTLFHPRRKVTQAVSETLDRFARRVLHTTIRQSESVNQAQLVGEDLLSYDPDCNAAIDYQALVREVSAWRESSQPRI